MVRYVFTPWRDRQELLLVRQQFYAAAQQPASAAPGPSCAVVVGRPLSTAPTNDGHDDTTEQQQQQQRQRRSDQHQAVARVSMWMQRGHCPHMVESTALLTAAVLSDEEVHGAAEHTAASSTYAIRAAYSAAFSRFVTGLLDGHQDKQRKQSMYTIAKAIGLPAAFVELRHQSTHEQLPSQAKLRSAAQQALAWIWDYYWKHLPEDAAAARPSALSRDAPRDPCAVAVLHYLRQDDEARRNKLRTELREWPRDQLIRTVGALRDSLPGNQAYLKCVKLLQELKGEEAGQAGADASMKDAGDDGDQGTRIVELADPESSGQTGETGTVREHESDQEPAKRETGWSQHPGPWKPKPIGVV
ncbi:hypothetical protein S7711_10174 [Stachybotrys chartarum IBT 7711]|uniref:Pre-rRNA-processing protein las1 n=1 Tax=Stachybotrys chartarum (strain CBS 109288 / IBT 7711) TaxID=1280523 RepID=A0A084AF16_STACB|nr:hypothetical protein S7711_10174 [Stachybotrys chartarum IBT 7711]